MEKSLIDAGMADIEENYKRISEKIACAALKSGRNPEDVRLMAVTKTVESVYINHAISLGAGLIGENRVQEYLGKKDELRLEGVEKHLIGHLQTNKVGKIVGLVDMIDSVDSVKIASEIGKASLKLGITTDVLVEVNIGNEESKFGFDPVRVSESIEQIGEIRGIRVKGLMAIPPVCEQESEVCEFFANMYRMFLDIKAKKSDNIDMNILSMGMSSDYEQAICEGSTMVRVGSALFGKRVY